jgi:apoptosis-inducing factor 2
VILKRASCCCLQADSSFCSVKGIGKENELNNRGNKMKQSSKHVVIFGGGVAGSLLAKALLGQAKVTLIDPHDYFEVPMAAPRALVEPMLGYDAIMRYADILPEVEHVQGRLLTADADQFVVELNDGRQRLFDKFDAAVLATGSAFHNDLMRAMSGMAEERKEFYHDANARLSAAKSVVIVGGGPLGVETAAELIEHYPSLGITLIEGGSRLLGASSERAAAQAEDFLTQRGVRVILNDRLSSGQQPGGDPLGQSGHAVTQKGLQFNYDLLLWCIGGRPNTQYMQPHLSGLLDENQRIKVKPSLQLEGHSKLFALGDITNLQENKMAWYTMAHVKVAARNIRTLLSNPGATSESLAQYQAKTGDPTMIVTLGSRQGVAQLPMPMGFKTWGWLTRMMKAKHMLVPKFRKLLLAS